MYGLYSTIRPIHSTGYNRRNVLNGYVGLDDRPVGFHPAVHCMYAMLGILIRLQVVYEEEDVDWDALDKMAYKMHVYHL